MRLILLSAFAFAILPASLAQTCIIVKKINDTIYVSADSRVRNDFKMPNGITQSITVDDYCKIKNVGKFYFAFAGSYPFQTVDTVSIDCKQNQDKSFFEVMKLTGKKTARLLATNLDLERKLGLLHYQQVLEKLKPAIMQIIFFGLDKDSLFMADLNFQVRSSIFERASVGYGINFDTVLLGGETQELMDTVHKATTWTTNIPATMIALTQIAKKNHPETIGGPVDIIKITLQGVKWICRKEQCQ